MTFEAERSLKDAGFWRREQVVKMDHIATARMLSVHPELADEALKRSLGIVLGFDRRKARVRATELLDRLGAEGALAELFESYIPVSPAAPPREGLIMVKTAAVIKRAVADKYGCSVSDLECECRSKALARARHEAMYLIARDTSFSYARIAKMFGDRDHTTVLNGIRKHAMRNSLPHVRMTNAAA